MAQVLFDLIWWIYYAVIRTRQYLLTNFDFDISNAVPLILSLISIYFTILSLYRTSRLAIHFVWFFLKWIVIVWMLGSSAGYIMSGGSVFGWGPVFAQVVSRALQQFGGEGWEIGGVPEVVADRHGIRVNGINLEIPQDYHQYGAAWQKFKAASANSNTRSHKGTAKSGGKTKPRTGGNIFNRFDSSSTTQSDSQFGKQRKTANSRSSDETPSVAQRLLSQALDFDAQEAWKSIEVIQEEVRGGFATLKEALGVPPTEDEREDNVRSWWSEWAYPNDNAKPKRDSKGTKSR